MAGVVRETSLFAFRLKLWQRGTGFTLDDVAEALYRAPETWSLRINGLDVTKREILNCAAECEWISDLPIDVLLEAAAQRALKPTLFISSLLFALPNADEVVLKKTYCCYATQILILCNPGGNHWALWWLRLVENEKTAVISYLDSFGCRPKMNVSWIALAAWPGVTIKLVKQFHLASQFSEGDCGVFAALWGTAICRGELPQSVKFNCEVEARARMLHELLMIAEPTPIVKRIEGKRGLFY